MGAGHAALISLRALALVVTMGVVALTAWSKIIIIDIENRGASVVDTMIFNTEQDREDWRLFFSTVLDNGFKIWIALACGSFTFLATLTVLLSNLFTKLFTKLHLRPLITTMLQALAFLATTTAFAFTLSATLALTNFSFNIAPSNPPPQMIYLSTSTSRALKSFSAMPPFSQTYTIASGSAGLLLLTTTIASTIQIVQNNRSTKACSFEPTASTLGMSHGYQASAPLTDASPASSVYGEVPGMYDPLRPAPVAMMDEEKGLIGGAADMGGRYSRESDRSGVDAGISGPLGLRRPEEAVMARPARPWSEMPKQR
ncbi:unnamed protein product [Periconia digitata]|uniref:Uncharacterized protein n=1 Tax=Periconia digitata TaxID=1303443 RepID=A0A9W4UGN6_9PLEO|nr:unnamed protein product [Periconia digitata]